MEAPRFRANLPPLQVPRNVSRKKADGGSAFFASIALSEVFLG